MVQGRRLIDYWLQCHVNLAGHVWVKSSTATSNKLLGGGGVGVGAALAKICEAALAKICEAALAKICENTTSMRNLLVRSCKAHLF